MLVMKTTKRIVLVSLVMVLVGSFTLTSPIELLVLDGLLLTRNDIEGVGKCLYK